MLFKHKYSQITVCGLLCLISLGEIMACELFTFLKSLSVNCECPAVFIRVESTICTSMAEVEGR